MSKKQFDEMQTQKRDQIGSQSFSLLVWLLMLDTLLYNLGIRWLAYPTDVFIIVLVCCGVFVIRTALSDSLVAPNGRRGGSLPALAVTMLLSVAAAVALVAFLRPHAGAAQPGSAAGAVILQVVSWGVLIAAAVIYLIKRHRDTKNDD